jgi:tetratricopeptide (TPR) repeat protein
VVTGRPKEAAAAYRKAAELFPPGSAEAYEILGEAALVASDYRAARENFEKSLSIDPSYLFAYRGLGQVHRALGEYDQAVAAFTKALQCPQISSIQVTNCYRDRGQLYIRQKNYAAALSDFNGVVELQPFHSFNYNGRGKAHFYLKHYEQALADIAKSLELRPDDLRNLTEIPLEDVASCPDEKFRTGMLALADKTIEIIESKPDASNLAKARANWYRVAFCLATGKLDQADRLLRDLFERLRKKDDRKSPDTARALGMVGSNLLIQQRHVAAEPFLREAVRLKPDSALYHNQLAWLLATCPELKLRDPGQAVEHAKKAVELAPGNGGMWNTLGVAQYRNGAWKAAVEASMKSVQFRKGGDSFDFFFLAMAHWQLGEKDKARAWYDRAVAWMDKNGPQDQELKRFRAEAAALLDLAKAAEEQKKKE